MRSTTHALCQGAVSVSSTLGRFMHSMGYVEECLHDGGIDKRNVGAAASKASTHAVCVHCCWQELPPASHQCMLLGSTFIGRGCRRRGTSACRLHPLLLAGAAAGEASAHVACMQCCRQ